MKLRCTHTYLQIYMRVNIYVHRYTPKHVSILVFFMGLENKQIS